MKKMLMYMLGLASIIFDVHGSSTVQGLSKLSILKKRPGFTQFSPQSIQFISPVMRQSVSRTIKEIENLKFQKGEGEVFVYNKKTGEGYIFDEDVVGFSPVLNGLLFN